MPPDGTSKSDHSLSASVLVVEDEAIVALDLVQMLKNNGYHPVISCATSQRAVQLAMEMRPDVVLMDIMLRGKGDGVGAAGVILRDYDIPVVFATSHTDAGTLKRALNVSPYGYLVKPLMAEEIHSSLQSALTRHGTERKIRVSEARLRTAFERSSVPFAMFDQDGVLLEANQHAAEVFGTAADEPSGFSLFDDIPLSDEQRRRLVEREAIDEILEVDLGRYRSRPASDEPAAGVRKLRVAITPLASQETTFYGYLLQVVSS